MQTECTPRLFEFEAVGRRSVVAGFDGGNITSNAGAQLLRQVDRGLGLMDRFADCFIDRRDPRYVETLMGWCEATNVDYVFGLARNRRLEAALVEPLVEAKHLCIISGRPARVVP